MNQKKKIHIGTSGWNYNHWKGTFYPDEMPKNEWFEYYCEIFHSVEINNSFYQLPNKGALQDWKDVAPDDFVFAVKASRYITHMKKLNDPREPLDNFLDRVKTLDKKLGPILFQLPPHWNVNIERLESFLELLPDRDKYVFEFRDESWWIDDVYECLRKHNAAFCIYELEKKISPREITADFVYVRLHGPGAKYEGKYDKETLAGWRGAFEAWSDSGKEIYMYFDNDQDGYAAQNARELQEML
ncbi:MAG TPA: DUF72 domain-containing protein [candidate division Zixibacteria bacterium]|nr:DUF72 domain-containing protein [candidate division Zixibacteria bacterium]